MENCLNCQIFSDCSDSRRSSSFRCRKYEPFVLRQTKFVNRLYEGTASQSALAVPSFGLDVDYGKAELDLSAMLDKVLDSTNSLVPKDLKIDDGDLKEYPNFYAFVMDPMGLGVRPFPRQMWIAMWLFSELCPTCSDQHFISDIFNCDVDEPLENFAEKVVFLESGTCPKCGATKKDLFKLRVLHPYNELAVCCGQRGGKSAFVSMASAYVVHKFLKLQKPTEVLGLLPNTTLMGTFVALTYAGSVDLLWNPVRDLITESPWFKNYHLLLDHYSEKYGEEIYKFPDTFLHYKHRKILLHPSGPNKRTLRGKTRIITAIDELGWFHAGQDSDDKEKLSGSEVYTALDRSLLTVRSAVRRLWKQGFTNVPMGFAFNVSSPSSAFDMIMQLVKNNADSRTVCTAHLATWELNPTITKRELRKEFKNDPIKAERDYGANPPLMSSPYIEDIDVIASTFGTHKNRVSYEYVHKKRNGKLYRAANLTNIRRPSTAYPSILAIDAGVTNNSFSLVIGHLNPNKEGRKVIVDVIVDIIPENGVRLHHGKIMENVVNPLIDIFNVQAMLADRWQSILMLDQTAETFGIYTQQYSVKRVDFDLVKSYWLGSQFVLPKLEMEVGAILSPNKDDYPSCFDFKPSSHLLLQALTVKDAGKTIIKGTDLTDDIFRALVLFGTFILDEDFTNQYLKVVKKRGSLGIGAIGLLSGGAASGIASSNVGSVGSMGGGGTGMSVVSSIFTRST